MGRTIMLESAMSFVASLAPWHRKGTTMMKSAIRTHVTFAALESHAELFLSSANHGLCHPLNFPRRLLPDDFPPDFPDFPFDVEYGP